MVGVRVVMEESGREREMGGEERWRRRVVGERDGKGREVEDESSSVGERGRRE